MDADTPELEILPRKSLAVIQADDEENISLYVLTEFENSAFTITASNGSKTWMGKVSNKEIKTMANRVEMPENSFLDEMLKALTRENVGNLNFAYAVRIAPNDCLEMTFKRHLVADNIRFQLGTVKLYPQPPDRAHSCLFRYAVDTIASLREQVAESNREKARLVNERQVALDQLERCVTLKEDIETDLFGKFKEVLNTKKGKIRALTEELSKVSERSHNSPEASHEAVMASNDHDDHTSGEEAQTPSPKPKPSSSVAYLVPSSSCDPAPSSLLDDVADTGGTSPPVKRKRRIEQKRPPPGKPLTIPKPPPAANSLRATEHGKLHPKPNPPLPASTKRPEQSLGSDELLDLL